MSLSPKVKRQIVLTLPTSRFTYSHCLHVSFCLHMCTILPTFRYVPIRFVRIAWQDLKGGHPAIPSIDEFISYMEDHLDCGLFLINMWNVYQATEPPTNNHLVGWHNCVRNSHPNLFKLIRNFQQEEASTHMTIVQLATGGRSHPYKKQCVV